MDETGSNGWYLLADPGDMSPEIMRKFLDGLPTLSPIPDDLMPQVISTDATPHRPTAEFKVSGDQNQTFRGTTMSEYLKACKDLGVKPGAMILLVNGKPIGKVISWSGVETWWQAYLRAVKSRRG